MLKLVLGRASTGKTTYVRNIIAQAVNAGESPVLIVPEQFSFESERAVINALGVKKAAEVEIYSFSSLGEKLISQYMPSGKPPVTEGAKAVIMSMALESVEERLDLFSDCSKSTTAVSQLLGVTDELIKCAVTSDMINSAARVSGNSVLISKAAEIGLIADAYEALLTSRFSDDRYLINTAAKIIEENELFRDRTVVFDEFTGFTAQEGLVLSRLLTNARDVYVTICSPDIYDRTEGTGAFSFSVRSIERLRALAAKAGVPVAQPIIMDDKNVYASAAVAALEKGLYLPSPEIYKEPAPEVTVAVAPNPYDECEYVAMTAKKLVREKGLRFRDIVVVSRSDDYGKYFPFAFKKYDIPVFEDTRKGLNEEIIVKYASAALTLAAKGFSTDGIFALLKTYISPLSVDDIAELENYVLMWQINYSSWGNRWKFHPEGFGVEETDSSRERLQYINSLRVAVILPLVKLKNALEDGDGFSCTKAVYDYLIETEADAGLLKMAQGLDEVLACECERSWDEFMSALTLLADTIGKRRVSPRRYLELFSIMISSSDIGDIPSGLDSITVGDADRIRVSDKKVLFVVGANEGIFPAGSQESFVLTESERRLLKTQGVELNEDGIESGQKERLRVYSVLSIPRDRLYISYSLGDFSGTALSPSEIVAQTVKIIPGCQRVEISLLDPIYAVESKRSAFECAASHFSDNTEVEASLKDYVLQTEGYADRLRVVDRLREKAPFSFENTEKATALFGKSMYITPSRIEEYYKCPFKYFCRYGVNARPLRTAAFDPQQNGLLVHFILERLFAKYGSKGLRELSYSERETAVEVSASEYIESRMGGTDSLDDRSVYSVKRSCTAVMEILERLVAEFSESSFETRDVELRIAADADVPPYSISVPDGGRVSISGVVDRVDVMDRNGKAYLRVIDYKTGSKDFNLADVVSGLNIQMLTYLVCLFENGKNRYGDVVPAGVLYVPARKGKNELPRDATDEDVERKRLEQGRMSGIVLEDEAVIRGMEKDGGGLIINAEIDDEGTITGSVFSMENFALLHKAIDRLAQDMALSLHKGKINARPVLDGSYKNTCSYCDYQSVCCREEGDEYATLFKGDAWAYLEEL